MHKITLNHVTKVEGHASLSLKINRNRVEKCQLEVIEGARFFEGLLPGRFYHESQEITSRICGICSCSHTICSLKAVEGALGVNVSKQTKLLRELLLLGEKIRSHTTHLYFFALPDYMGFESAIEMASKNKEKINTALELIKLGNLVAETIGGREMHPFTCVLGGFTSIPEREKFDFLLNQLKVNKEGAVKTAELFAKIKCPQFEKEAEHLCLKKGAQYPLLEGSLVSDKSFKSEQEGYSKHIQEHIETYATAKFAVKKGKEYRVGALARLNNSFNLLNNHTKNLIKKLKINFPSNNPFYNNLAQAAEIMDAIERAAEIIRKNRFKKEEIPEIEARRGRGIAAIEAPRGILFHDYSIDAEGKIARANIITPTSQNLRVMESDIQHYVNILLNKRANKQELVLEIEKLIRAYDPCFSCSTHFLKVNWL